MDSFRGLDCNYSSAALMLSGSPARGELVCTRRKEHQKEGAHTYKKPRPSAVITIRPQ